MGTCIIFCAGEFDGLAEPIGAGDYLLAADGGLLHLRSLGLEPDGIIGDFDSLGYVPQDAVVFPVEKDDTDSMLAVRQGLELGYRRFVLYGAMGGSRLDHTIANLQTLQFIADHGGVGHLVGAKCIVTLIKNAGVTFPETARGTISVFCMGRDAEGVTIENLQYPLRSGTLTAGYPMGVSNHFIGKKSTISVKNGSLFIFSDLENGVPEVTPC